MAQRTLINGTGYTIIGGRTLIDGTGYAIKKGRTLIGGTGYDIKLNKYRLDSWIGGDGDEYITELSRSWSAIRKGQDVSHSMTTKVSASTNGKAYSGFLLTGLEVGDKVEIAYSFETTAGNSSYIDCIMQFYNATSGFCVDTPNTYRRTVTGTATGTGCFIYIAVGRYYNYAYTTTPTIHSLKVNGEQII